MYHTSTFLMTNVALFKNGQNSVFSVFFRAEKRKRWGKNPNRVCIMLKAQMKVTSFQIWFNHIYAEKMNIECTKFKYLFYYFIYTRYFVCGFTQATLGSIGQRSDTFYFKMADFT